MKIVMVQSRALIGFNDNSQNTIDTKRKNFENIIKLLKKIENKKCDIIILPELFSVGWYPSIYPKSYETLEDSPTMNFLSDLSKEFSSNVIGGSFVLKTESGLKNSCPIFNREGKLLAIYEKMHLFSHYEQGEGEFSASGENGCIVKTDVGSIGVSICYDIRFPELYRAYTYNGADLLVNVAAWPKTRLHHYQTLIRARAIENQIFTIGVTQTGLINKDEYNSGYSLAVNPFGDIIKTMNEKEGAVLFEIDLNEQKELRSKVPTLKDKKQNYKINFIGV